METKLNKLIENNDESMPIEWKEVFLVDLCKPKQWKTISISKLVDTGYVVYGANGKIGFYSEYTHKNPTLMITCRGANCGNLHLSEPLAYINGNAMALDELVEKYVVLKYLYYVLKARGLNEAISGSAQPQITQQGLLTIKVKISSLSEQKLIAARLDALLAQVDTLKTRLDAIPTILKRFRQSVLAAAVSGKLTEQWRGKNKFEDVGEEIKKIQDVRNNKGAFGKKRKPDFSFHNLEKPHRNIPREWKLVQLGEVINELTDYHANGSYEVLKQHVELKEKEDFACMIRATNFEKNNFNDLLIYITKDAYNFLEKSKLFGGEVLICKIGNAGSVYYMPNLDRPASLAMNLFAIRFNNELINSKYVYFYLKSQFGENDIQKYVRGVATKSIDKQSVRSIFVNLPSFNEQTEIVRRVDQLFAFADQIEQRVAEAKKRVDHLTQSILAKAFRGDLTADWRAQNPDLISGENSAEALLARIRAERAVASASPTRKPGKRRSGT